MSAIVDEYSIEERDRQSSLDELPSPLSPAILTHSAHPSPLTPVNEQNIGSSLERKDDCDDINAKDGGDDIDAKDGRDDNDDLGNGDDIDGGDGGDDIDGGDGNINRNSKVYIYLN